MAFHLDVELQFIGLRREEVFDAEDLFEPGASPVIAYVPSAAVVAVPVAPIVSVVSVASTHTLAKPLESAASLTAPEIEPLAASVALAVSMSSVPTVIGVAESNEQTLE
jgi:hypothetical protein